MDIFLVRHAIAEERRLDLPDAGRALTERGRERFQVVILSDTFYEFAEPFMRKLGWPTLLCHKLEIEDDRIAQYCLRQKDQKREAVKAFHGLNFRVIAAGDSYNDTSMLGEADAGILFCPPQNVIDEFPQFPVTSSYDELKQAFIEAEKRIDG